MQSSQDMQGEQDITGEGESVFTTSSPSKDKQRIMEAFEEDTKNTATNLFWEETGLPDLPPEFAYGIRKTTEGQYEYRLLVKNKLLAEATKQWLLEHGK